MIGGEIKVVLTLDDKDFTIKTVKAGSAVTNLASDISRTSSAVEAIERRFNSFGTQLHQAIVTISLARGALLSLHEIFLSFPLQVLKTSAEFERLEALMRGMSKASTEAGKALEGVTSKKFIIDLGRNTPFEIKAISDAFVKLKSAGLDPTDGSLRALLDSVAKFGGGSDIMHRASIAIQQMAGKGVISMEELRQQLGEAVPNAIQELARVTGNSMKDLVRLIGQGVVESKSHLHLLAMQMRVDNVGASEEMMKTFAGLTERLKTVWQQFQLAIGESTFLKEATKQVIDLIDVLDSRDAKAFAIGIGESLGAIVRGIRGIIDFMREWGTEIRIVGEIWLAYWSISKITGWSQAFIGAIGSVRAAFAEKSNQVRIGKAAMDEYVIAIQRANVAEDIANTGRLKGRFVSEAMRELMRLQVIEQRALAVAYAETAVAANAAAVAQSGGAILLSALGGWVGILTLALSLGAIAWFEWGNKAEDALKKIEDAARNGISTKAQVDQINKLVELKKKELALAQGPHVKSIDEEGRTHTISGAEDETREKLEKELHALQTLAKQAQSSYTTSIQDEGMREGTKFAQQTEIMLKRQYDDQILILRDYGVTHGLTLKEISKREHNMNAERYEEEVKLLNDYVLNQKEIMTRADPASEEAERARGRIMAAQDEVVRLKRLIWDWRHAEGELLNGKDRGLTPLERALAQAKGQAALFGEELEDITSGALKSQPALAKLREETAKLMEQYKDGLFDFKDKVSGNMVRPPIAQVQELAQLRARIDGLKEANTALKEFQKLSDKADTDNDILNERVAHGGEKMSSGMRAARVEVDLLTAKLKPLLDTLAAKGLLAAGDDKLAIFDQYDQVTKFAQEKGKKILGVAARKDAEDFITSERDKIQALKDAVGEDKRAIIARQYQSEHDMLENHYDTLIAEQKEFGQDTLRIELAKYDHLVALGRKYQRDSETPLQTLARNWKNVALQMENATAEWAKRSIDYVMDFVDTGKIEFGKFTASVLKDILRIQLQAQWAGPLSQGLGAVGDIVGKFIGGGGGSTTPTGSQAPTFNPSMYINPNAMGGIVDEFGAVALKKYAAGGIATRPQVSVFGEGSSPEAYVPLPDGRSIPVTMNSAPSVCVNVINQTNQQVTAEQSAPRFDDEKMILDVVLKNVTRPGPFRTAVKGAVGA